MRRANRAAVVSLLALAVFAGACGNAATTTQPAGTRSSQPAAASQSAATASQPAPAPSLSGTLTVYSGRSESLVGPLVERFRTVSGLDVQVKYAGTTELASTILEEGDASPADVFFSQDGGALGAIAAEGRLAPISAASLDLVDPRYRSPDGVWVGVSGRARVVAYNTQAVSEADLPTSIEGYTDSAWKGRIGWAPTNASFQTFVTAFRVLKGEAEAKAWLEAIQANEPKVFDGNDAVLAALASGEIDVGFINHYYLMRQLTEQGSSFPVRNHFLPGGDVGALVNVAGAAALTTSPNPAAAQAFIDFLLSPDSQTYFADETYEYPLVEGIPADERLVPLADIQAPDIDLSELADLEGTLRLLQEAGVL